MPPKKKSSGGAESGIGSMQAALVGAMEDRRKALCKPPLYPGSPDDYRYIPERCQRITPQLPRRPERARKGMFSYTADSSDVAQAKQFLHELESNSAEAADDISDPSGWKTIALAYEELQMKIAVLVRAVLDDSARKSTPDLLKRIKLECKKQKLKKIHIVFAEEIICQLIAGMHP